MISRISCLRQWSRAAVTVAVLGLSGCANLGDSFVSGAFADPAKYDYYDCKQLEIERKSLTSRAADLQGLIVKAETAVGGSVVAELAYGSDYTTLRAQNKMADEAWRRYKCHETLPVASATTPAAVSAPPAKGEPQRSGGAIY